jgi:hypothetical protein
MKIRDEFDQDLGINFQTGIVARATDKFTDVYKNEFAANRFRQCDLMKELVKEPGSRDPDRLSDLVALFINLRFMD